MCGVGSADNVVVIWNLLPALDAAKDADPTVSKRLATLTAHDRSVNCVRWSPCGRYLASGSDDTNILIWGLSTMPAPSANLGAMQPNSENWRTVARLAGHTADVVDLAWSPCQTMLASCGVDNTVRIWQTDTWKAVQVLTGHTSIVRGVSWDPLSKFVLSQAEDSSAIVWRTEDWQIASRITEPFRTKSNQTYFRRASWMPDGSYVVVAGAFKAGKHSVTVLQRGTWDIESEFIGHNGPVICSSCNPHVFKKKIGGDKPGWTGARAVAKTHDNSI